MYVVKVVGTLRTHPSRTLLSQATAAAAVVAAVTTAAAAQQVVSRLRAFRCGTPGADVECADSTTTIIVEEE